MQPERKGTVLMERHGWEAFGIPTDAGDGFAFNREWVVGGRAGEVLNDRGVMQLSAAMACVRLLSQTISTLPVGIYERVGEDGRKPANDHPLYELLHNQPNADMTAVDFWQVIVAAMMLRGNAVCEKLYVGARLVAIDPLDPMRVSWQWDTAGVLHYWYTGRDNQRREIPVNRIWHIPAFTFDGIIGISPIAYGARVFGAAGAADEASLSVFANGMNPAGFVNSTAWLKEEQRNSIRESLQKYTGSRNSGKTMVLEGGMTYTQLTMNPEDAQMLETRQFSIEEICRWFGVPPTLIGHGDKTSNWGTGLEQNNLNFLTYHLRAWISKLEQSARKNLLSQADKVRFFAEFSVEGLLRADTSARAAFYSQMVNNGLMTRDEVRIKENLPQKGGNADVLTVQTALTPLDKLGEQVTPPAQPPATPPTEGNAP